MKCNQVAWCCSIFTLLVLGAIATLIAWGVSNPKDPHFSVASASVSGYNLTTTTNNNNNLTSTFDIHVTAYNPNPNYFIYYDVVLVSVYNSNGTLLAYEVLPDPFSHRPKAQLSLKAGLAAQNVSLTSSGPRAAEMEVRVRAVTRFKYKGWKRFHHMMKAVCSPVTVKFDSSTSEASGAQQTRCYVNTY